MRCIDDLARPVSLDHEPGAQHLVAALHLPQSAFHGADVQLAAQADPSGML